jgi:predicted RNase H-like nuclease (RuvC/YqgF family)
VEAFLNWLIGSLGWDALKKLFTLGRSRDVALLRQAVEDAQHRNRLLAEDRALMERLVEQRNVLGAKLVEAQRRIAELEQQCADLRRRGGSSE